MSDPVSVAPQDWHAAVSQAVADGHAFPELLVGADRGGAIELTARLLDDGWQARTLQTRLAPTTVVDTVADVLPGLAWAEREIAEMLGVRFTGGDDRPLLRRDVSGPPPLLATTPLPARVATPWPGAAEPGLREGDEGMQRRAGNPSRRRQRPPGIPDSWQEGTR